MLHRKDLTLVLENPAPAPSRARLMVEATAPFAGAALITVTAFLLFQGSLPDKIATHFTLGGNADRYSTPATTLGQYLLLFAIQTIGALGVVFSIKAAPRAARGLRTFCCGLAAGTAYDLIATLWVVSDSSGRNVHLPSYQWAVDVLVGAGVAAAVWFASRSRA
ncbi:DUF1648 domain-containing protein [Streptomyces sp. NPDC020801]|uniref:DUF1648 domain-containing protein n=1 Tax=Streptomyces sp. NPDC020801 TaxID=3365093 RepID=UPI00379213CF